ncbi:hypothetical protein FB45DRAFT_899834 [Roridomyces roridus]|uniref:Uncharacterized protein n=1 Tax=Roridomyces roridus TaxID=1738132 RepID=A0AAD7C7A5_9AGAR|nr:hypothetical protein FB45DRAFT_899834 [Roridomyces roridus]
MSSPRPGALTLGNDVVDRIMTFCPDFGTLHKVALVSKEFLNVYRNHPKSITRAVAYNIVGPALPAAIRLIRYPLDDHVSTDTDPVDVATACPEGQNASTLTGEEQCRLLENAAIVQALEDVFSLRHKSRFSRSSVLTGVESERFRRAAYRAMLFYRLFPGDNLDYDELSDMDADQVERVRERRAAVLDVYKTRELLELYSFVRFMRWIFREVSQGESGEHLDVLLSSGPEGALQAWESQTDDGTLESIGYSFVDDATPFLGGYYSLPFATIWEKRKEDPLFISHGKDQEGGPPEPPNEDDGASPAWWLLDEVHGENDTCSHCAAPNGLKLLTETNWHKSRLMDMPTQLLKGLLNRSPSVTQVLSALLREIYLAAAPASPWPELRGPHQGVEGAVWVGKVFDFAEEMYRGQPTNASTSTSELATWGRSDSLCEDCLKRFLQEHVWRWVLAERVKGGWVPPEDCWYGYNCRTQTDKQAHELGKNVGFVFDFSPSG